MECLWQQLVDVPSCFIGNRVLKKEAVVVGGFDKQLYRTFRIWAQSADNAQVSHPVMEHIEHP